MNRNKFILITIVGLVLFVGSVLLYGKSQGSVTIISSDSSARLYMYEAGREKDLGTGRASISGPGQYTVFGQSNDAVSVITFEVRRWEHEEKSLRLEPPVSSTVFSKNLAKSLIVRNEIVRFLHPETYEALETTATGQPELISGFPRVRTLIWVDFDTAIFEDLSGEYSIYNDGHTKPLRVGGQVLTTSVTSVIAANRAGEVALIANQRLYYTPDINESFEVIGTDVQSDAAISVMNGKVAYAEKLEAGDDTSEGEGSLATNNPQFTLYDAANRSAQFSVPVPLNNQSIPTLVQHAALSPLVSKVILTTVDGVYVIDLKSEQANKIMLGPKFIPLNAMWYPNSDKQLLFVTEGGLWKMDIESQVAQFISSAERISVGESITISDGYLWFTDSRIGRFGTGNIKRLILQ